MWGRLFRQQTSGYLALGRSIELTGGPGGKSQDHGKREWFELKETKWVVMKGDECPIIGSIQAGTYEHLV